MNHPDSLIPLVDWLKTERYFRWIAMTIWTLTLLASLGWNLFQHERSTVEQARVMARTAFLKDVLYRSWNSMHGGVYVPVTSETLPNPYLKDFPQRDITSTTGKQYTLINPAYMTRQVFELQVQNTGIIGHITSLDPIRPGNAADPWETAALKEFESGASKEVSSVETLNGESYLRLISPLITEERCLKCHASQGYQVGQVRGGITESVALTPLRSAAGPFTISLIIAHAVIWQLGVIGILATTMVLRRSVERQHETERKLLQMSTHDTLTGLYNRTYFEEVVKELEGARDKPLSILMADINNLKKTNDQSGHDAGDELIRRTADVFRESFRDEDTIARIGGDEFAVILPDTDPEIAQKILERLWENLLHHNALHAGFPLEISIGQATAAPGETLQATFKLADQAMYAEKARMKGEKSGS
jgi:diguanylate cyclase (GGDEF)-like protein